MSDNQIHYEELAKDALRGMIRKIMADIEVSGELPGEHHFFIAFDTCADGVNMSSRLKEQYQEDMTIVLQHQFWDLKSHEEYFEVKLSFNNVLEHLVIPYKAIKVFFDPSVPYGLQFDPQNEEDGDIASPDSLVSDILEDSHEKNVALPNSEFTMESSAEDKKEADEDAKDNNGKSATVVSLDTFRKK